MLISVAVYRNLPNQVAYRNSEINTSKCYTNKTTSIDLFEHLISQLNQEVHDIQITPVSKSYDVFSDPIFNRRAPVLPRFLVYSCMARDGHATTVYNCNGPYNRASARHVIP